MVCDGVAVGFGLFGLSKLPSFGNHRNVPLVGRRDELMLIDKPLHIVSVSALPTANRSIGTCLLYFFWQPFLDVAISVTPKVGILPTTEILGFCAVLEPPPSHVHNQFVICQSGSVLLSVNFSFKVSLHARYFISKSALIVELRMQTVCIEVSLQGLFGSAISRTL